MLYPWVDLYPDSKLRSVYSGKSFDTEDLIRDDARIEAARARRLEQIEALTSAVSPHALAEVSAAVEDQLPYNCEHVVPQSSFA